MEPPIRIFGPEISTYVRIVSMVAQEVGAEYEVVPTASGSPENRKRHPFGKSPAAEIDGLVLYESVAIAQYLDDTRNDGGLQPTDAEARARMTQWLSIANCYLFPSTEHGLVLPRLVVPLMGEVADERLIERALPVIAYQTRVVSERLEASPYLAGPSYSLADVFMFVVLRAVQLTPEGRALLDGLLPLKRWLQQIDQRPSVDPTRWPGEVERLAG